MTDESVTPIPSGPLTVTAFGVTDKGKVRPINEDQFLIAELTKAMRVRQTSLREPKLQVGEERAHLFLVADGMGGHQAGERPRGRRDRAVHLSHSDGFLGPTVRMRRESLRSSKQRFVTPMPALLKKPRSTPNYVMGTTVR